MPTEYKVVVSDHANDRWIEYGGRIHILHAFADAVFIGTDFYEDQNAEYYIWEDKIFVFNPESMVIITVINVNYNLAPHINRTIINKQTKLVLKLLEQAELASTKHELKKIELGRKLETTERQIEAYDKKIEALKHIRNATHEQLSRYEKEAEAAHKEHRAELTKLYYSVSHQIKSKKTK